MRGQSKHRPNLRLATDRELPSSVVIGRSALGLIAVVNPVIGLTVMAVRMLGKNLRRPMLLALAGLAGTIVSLALMFGKSYTAPYKALVRGIVWDSPDAIRASIWAWAADAPKWITGQLPFGVSVGLLIGGILLAWRSRYRADWRRGEGQQEAPDKQIQRAKTQLSAKTAKQKTQTETVTGIQIPLGVTADSAQPYYLPASALNMHGLIAGPSGFGKTQSLLALLHGLTYQPAARALKLPCVIIDMKADSALRGHVSKICTDTGRKMWLIEAQARSDNARWSPMSGSASEIRAKLIEAEANAADGGFSEPHYRRVGERFLLVCAKALVDLADNYQPNSKTGRPWRRSLSDLVQLMDIGMLEGQLDLYSPALAPQIVNYIEEARASKIEGQLYGIRTRYALIAESAAGEVLETSENTSALDLYGAIKAGDIILFSLDAGADPAGARALGNLVLQELVFTCARLQREGWGENPRHFCPVFIDEFSALGGSILLNLYARARSAGAGIILATQDLDADLGAVGEEFAAAVMTNANVGIYHRQKGEAASKRAEAIGTELGWTETVQIMDDWGPDGSIHAASGVGSLREADKFVIHPNEFKGLPQGVAYVIVEHPEKTITKVAINRPTLETPASNAATNTPTPATPKPVPAAEAVAKTPVPASAPALPDAWSQALTRTSVPSAVEEYPDEWDYDDATAPPAEPLYAD